MKDWREKDWRASRDDPEAELREADLLLSKADALLRRHQVPGQTGPTDTSDDLPLLTDVVEDLAFDPGSEPEPVAGQGNGVALAELLVDLDTELAREIEFWFANELPQLVASELDRFSENLRREALAHMRATLIPSLSERISNRLDRGSRSR
ncbi:MAG TPA: hypothetical protein PK725_01965 [Rhodocyclaceae bacterium]|jgi:hypothetical protein|nr:hypothetical protein [Rhodocyclaceae bacterium]HRQ45683.1 hypothetical protein [Rhodocyclaceae bacterium]